MARPPTCSAPRATTSITALSHEDAAELSDVKAFTCDLTADAERDLGSRLDWVAVDYWNTEHPHMRIVGLDPETAKHRDGCARRGADRPRRLRPGTVLVPEYQRERHTVTVVPKGYV